jgi:hypothetical protein
MRNTERLLAAPVGLRSRGAASVSFPPVGRSPLREPGVPPSNVPAERLTLTDGVQVAAWTIHGGNFRTLRDSLISTLIPLGAVCVAGCSGAASEGDGTSGSGGVPSGTAGTAGAGGTAGTGGAAGTAGAGGSTFVVPPGGRDCYSTGLGTCCLYDYCFTAEQFAEFASYSITDGSDAGDRGHAVRQDAGHAAREGRTG